jgi:hypothetical protein
MKLPSLQHAATEALRTLKRFPLVLLAAVIGVCAALILLERGNIDHATPLFNTLLAAILGVPWFLGLAVLVERKDWRKAVKLAIQAAGVLLLIGYARSLPSYPDGPFYPLARLLILITATILFAMLAPYLRKDEVNGFWQYNRHAWFRFFTTMLYSAVLFIGLTIALAAVDQLFGIDIPAKRYQELWVILAGLFSVWFFLAGLPEDWPALEQSSAYPSGLKIFAQYIATPLVALYLIILYVYVLKIVLAWDWPKGFVSKLILGFSGSGLFSLLLLYPVKEEAGNRWIKIAWRWFFVVLIPLLIMLPFAVWRRVIQYGITEGRYLALLLAGVLAILVVYFIFSKNKSIKMIPAMLGLALLLICYGPWSIFEISEHNQIGRLEQIALRNNRLKQGVVQTATTEISTEDAQEIRSILSYLRDMHGYGGIRHWFDADLQHSSQGIIKWMSVDSVAQMLGAGENATAWTHKDGLVTLKAKTESGFDIAGYDRLFPNQYFGNDNPSTGYGDKNFSCTINNNLEILTCFTKRGEQILDSMQIDLARFAEQVCRNYERKKSATIPLEEMTVYADGAGLRVKIYLLEVQMSRQQEVLKPDYYTMMILYARNNGR